MNDKLNPLLKDSHWYNKKRYDEGQTMSKISLPLIIDSFRSYVEQLLVFYWEYRGKEPFSDTWESKYLLPEFPPTDESILFLPDDRALLEQQVVETLESLSLIPLSYLPLDLLLDWGRDHASASPFWRLTLPSQDYTSIEQLQIKAGTIQKTGEGLFKFSNEKQGNRNYIDHVVDKVLISFHAYIEFEVLGDEFKAKTSGCFGNVGECTLYNVEKEVFLQLVKEYSDEQRRFSILELNNLTSAEQYFLVYKAINIQSVNMSIVNDDPNLEEWQKTPHLAVIRTQRKLTATIAEEFRDRPQEMARFFELVMSDTTVSDDPNSFDYSRTEDSICDLLEHTEDIFHEYLSDICLEVVTNDSVGGAVSKKEAIAELIEQKDTRIVPLIKEWAEDESSSLHKRAEIDLFGAIREMPEYFTDSKYDRHKAAIEESNRRWIVI